MNVNDKVKIIEVSNFTKDYGSNRGVFNISFEVFKGDFFGFLGPNGAGKSTTIRHIMGFSKPDKGDVKIYGKDAHKFHSSLMNDVGYLPGEVNLPTYLTAKEFLNETKKLKHVHDLKYFGKLIELFPLNLDQEIKFMSLGDKRKLAIISAFMNNPNILILDEPTSGLDPISQDAFLKFLIDEKSRGKTIFLSSHIFREVDETCDKIAIIKDGKIVSNFVKEDFNKANENAYEIFFVDEKDYYLFKSRIGKNIHIDKESENRLMISIKVDANSLSDLFFCLKNIHIKEIKQSGQSLEQYFLSFYKEDLNYHGI